MLKAEQSTAHQSSDDVLTATGFLRALFIFDPRRFVGQRQLALAAALLATLVAVLVVRPYDFTALNKAGLLADGHMLAALEKSINKGLCGLESRLYARPTPINDAAGNPRPSALRVMIVNDPGLLNVPFRQLIEREFAPLPQYCATPMHPFTNNENALYLIYATALAISPDLSVANLATIATTLRIAMLALIAYAIIALGGGLVWAFLSVFLGLKLHGMTVGTHVLSIYPYMTFHLSALAALLALAYAWGSRRGWSATTRVLVGAAIGVAAFAIWNMRTSHGLVAIVGLVFVALLVLLRGAEFTAGTSRWKAVGAVVAACLLVGVVTHKVSLRNIPETNFNYTFHTVSHPLVLGLAVPENALAKREGLKWDDSIGTEVARRVDPQATYLGPTYERAMFTYYFGLWQKYPADMLSVYVSKFSMAGTDIPFWTKVTLGKAADWALAPVSQLMRSGWLWLAVQSLAALAAGWMFISRGGAHWLGLAFLLSTGALLLAEHAIILPGFNITHFGSLLQAGFLESLLIYQMACNLVAAAVVRYLLGR